MDGVSFRVRKKEVYNYLKELPRNERSLQLNEAIERYLLEIDEEFVEVRIKQLELELNLHKNKRDKLKEKARLRSERLKELANDDFMINRINAYNEKKERNLATANDWLERQLSFIQEEIHFDITAEEIKQLAEGKLKLEVEK